MLYRLVRPVIREGSSNRYFVKRVPADVRQRAAGLRLNVPIGDQRSAATITGSGIVRLSLRTSDPREVKRRHAAVDAYLENVWQSLRQNEPVALTHKQAVALAGRLYRAWAVEDDRHTIISLDLEPGRMSTANVTRGRMEPGAWAAVADALV